MKNPKVKSIKPVRGFYAWLAIAQGLNSKLQETEEFGTILHSTRKSCLKDCENMQGFDINAHPIKVLVSPLKARKERKK